MTDGTPGGTRLVKDINPDNDILEVFRGSKPQWLNDLGDGRMIFRARDDIFGGRDEPWISDGTAAGRAMIREVGGSAISSEPSGITRLLPGLVVYSANNGTTSLDAGHVGRELWVSDGSYAGTRLLADINPVLAGSNPVGMTAIGYGQVVFAADNGANGRELWITDGTAGGTHMLRDLVPGAGGTTATSFAALPDGRVALCGTGFVTDGTAAGTDAPGESDRTSLPMPEPFTGDPAPGEWAVTWATDGGGQLPDGRTIFEGEFLQLDASGNLSRWASEQLMVSDGKTHLWVTDGTAGGTRVLTEGVDSYQTIYTDAANGRVLLGDGKVVEVSPGTWSLAYDIWLTDGTLGGTRLFAAGDGPVQPADRHDHAVGHRQGRVQLLHGQWRHQPGTLGAGSGHRRADAAERHPARNQQFQPAIPDRSCRGRARPGSGFQVSVRGAGVLSSPSAV